MALTLIAAGASAMLAIGRQEDPSITNLETTLDGANGGSVVDGSVSLPKRVGVNDKRRSDLAGLLALPLPARLGGEAAFEAIPQLFLCRRLQVHGSNRQVLRLLHAMVSGSTLYRGLSRTVCYQSKR